MHWDMKFNPLKNRNEIGITHRGWNCQKLLKQKRGQNIELLSIHFVEQLIINIITYLHKSKIKINDEKNREIAMVTQNEDNWNMMKQRNNVTAEWKTRNCKLVSLLILYVMYIWMKWVAFSIQFEKFRIWYLIDEKWKIFCYHTLKATLLFPSATEHNILHEQTHNEEIIIIDISNSFPIQFHFNEWTIALWFLMMKLSLFCRWTMVEYKQECWWKNGSHVGLKTEHVQHVGKQSLRSFLQFHVLKTPRQFKCMQQFHEFTHHSWCFPE